MKRTTLTFGLSFVLLMGTVACEPAAPTGTVQEDCDFDDMLEGDSDCDTKKKSKKAKSKLKKRR